MRAAAVARKSAFAPVQRPGTSGTVTDGPHATRVGRSVGAGALLPEGLSTDPATMCCDAGKRSGGVDRDTAAGCFTWNTPENGGLAGALRAEPWPRPARNIIQIPQWPIKRPQSYPQPVRGHLAIPANRPERQPGRSRREACPGNRCRDSNHLKVKRKHAKNAILPRFCRRVSACRTKTSTTPAKSRC